MSALFGELQDRAREAMGRLGVPGMALGVIADGQTHTAGLGVTNVDHPLGVDADTLFQIGSITKTFTGTAAMRLAAAGRLDLDAPVRRYLPELRLRDQATAAHVTTRHLLTHLGGFSGDFFLDTGWGDDALARYVARMDELEQIAPLGTLFSYCNSGFALAARVIEAITALPVERAIHDLVLAPLAMDRAFFFPWECMTYRFAAGHRGGEGGAQVLRPWPIPRASSAVGAISTSVTQLLRYAALHLAPDDALAPMQVAQAEAGNFADQVGVTWMLRSIGGELVVGHGGATNGQMAQLTLVPARGLAIALLTNADGGRALNQELQEWALEAFAGLRPAPASAHTPDAATLAGYAGRYRSGLTHLEVTPSDGGLQIQVIPQGGFPDLSTPPGPPPPPVRASLSAPDRLVVQDAPYRGNRAEFGRDAAGQVAWLRFGGRAHMRG